MEGGAGEIIVSFQPWQSPAKKLLVLSIMLLFVVLCTIFIILKINA